MIRLTRLADYGFALLACLTRDGDDNGGSPGDREVYNAHELAELAGLPEPVAGKILKKLTKAGLLISQRGARGGYGLARSPETISAVDVITALEGPLALTHCSETPGGACQREDTCQMGGHWQGISQALNATLSEITLADLARANPPSPQPLA